MTSGLIIAIVLVVLALALVGMYNSLITLKNRVDEAWSDIDVQLKRRYDLIPNLVNTVKGYATHEKELFEKVTEARTAAMGASTPAEKEATENALSGTLKTLFAVSENYPALQASQKSPSFTPCSHLMPWQSGEGHSPTRISCAPLSAV